MKPLRTYLVAAALTVAVAGPASAASSSEKPDRGSDLWAEATIVTSYTLNRHLNPFKLDVEVTKGTAVISGNVDNAIERDLAVAIARGVDGVNKVEENIKIVSEPPAERSSSEFFQDVSDATTTATVRSKLLWNANTNGLDIGVETNDGTVTLTGTASSDAQRQLAGELAENTDGVKQVNNKITVVEKKAESSTVDEATAAVSDAWITTKVKSSLLYSRNVDGFDIDVDTDDGVVTLKGTVDSPTQKQRATSVARGVVGVKVVRDQLQVAKVN